MGWCKRRLAALFNLFVVFPRLANLSSCSAVAFVTNMNALIHSITLSAFFKIKLMDTSHTVLPILDFSGTRWNNVTKFWPYFVTWTHSLCLCDTCIVLQKDQNCWRRGRIACVFLVKGSVLAAKTVCRVELLFAQLASTISGWSVASSCCLQCLWCLPMFNV